jgi:tetratricopeptide (TPR) repeat protein
MSRIRARAWSILVAGGVLGLAGCGKEKPADPNRARFEVEAGEPRRAIAERPEAALPHFQLGQLYGRYNMLDSARTEYETCVALDRSYADAYFELAKIHYTLGRLEEAAQAFEEVVRLRPDHAWALNNLGFVYKKLGRLGQAEQAYQRAIAADSTFAEAYNNLGQLYKLQERFADAIALYRRAIALNPRFAEAYVNLAMIYREQGQASPETEALRAYLERFGDAGQHSEYVKERLQQLATGAAQAAAPAQGAQ